MQERIRQLKRNAEVLCQLRNYLSGLSPGISCSVDDLDAVLEESSRQLDAQATKLEDVTPSPRRRGFALRSQVKPGESSLR